MRTFAIDNQETYGWLSPVSNDTDGDDIEDNIERDGYAAKNLWNGSIFVYTNATLYDSDSDGIGDGQEVDGWNITIAWYNSTGDLCTEERQYYTDPSFDERPYMDSDEDGISDYDEIYPEENPIFSWFFNMPNHNKSAQFNPYIKENSPPIVRNMTVSTRYHSWYGIPYDYYTRVKVEVYDVGLISELKIWVVETSSTKVWTNTTNGWYQADLDIEYVHVLSVYTVEIFTMDVGGNHMTAREAKWGTMGDLIRSILDPVFSVIFAFVWYLEMMARTTLLYNMWNELIVDGTFYGSRASYVTRMLADKATVTWGVCGHENDFGLGKVGDGKTDNDTLDDAINHVDSLSMKYMRTDIWLDDFISERDAWGYYLEHKHYEWNGSSIEEYNTLIDRALDKGKEVILILNFRKGQDHWVHKSYTKHSTDFFYSLWKNFSKMVGETFGDRVYYYQILNEENWFQWEKIYPKDEPKVFIKAYEGLKLEECPNIQEDSQHTQYFKTIVNILTATGKLWLADVSRWLTSEAGSSIDIIGIDHYPLIPGDYVALGGAISLAESFNKEWAIMETGANRIWYRGRILQIASEMAMFAIKAIAILEEDFAHDRFNIACWYELYDSHEDPELWEYESHMGLIAADHSTPWPSYYVLKSNIPLHFTH